MYEGCRIRWSGLSVVSTRLQPKAGTNPPGCHAFYRLHRCLLDNPHFEGVWEHGLRFRVLIWLYMHARYQDELETTPQGQTLGKGDLVTSYDKLAKEVNWKAGQGGAWQNPDPSSVSRAVHYLANLGLIDFQADGRGIQITVHNYGECPLWILYPDEEDLGNDGETTGETHTQTKDSDSRNSQNNNEIEEQDRRNGDANEGENGSTPRTYKEERRKKEKKKSSSPKGGGSKSQRADARPSRGTRLSSSEQHHRNGGEKFQGGISIMAEAGGYPEDVKKIIAKLRPVAISVYKAKRKPFPKQWHTDNCHEIEEWVTEGKNLEEISDLLGEALADDWWGKWLQSISMLRKFEEKRAEIQKKRTKRTPRGKSNLCPVCGKANFYCKCSNE